MPKNLILPFVSYDTTGHFKPISIPIVLPLSEVFTSGNSLKFIDLHKLSPNPVLSIDSHEGLVSTILFPPKLKDCVISAGEDCSVRINDIRVGKGVKSFYHTNYVNSVAIGNNNKEIIAADENGTIKIWDIDKGEVRTEYNSDIKEEGLAFRSISLVENEGFLVGEKSNGNVCVFDYNNNSLGQNLGEPKIFEAHKNYITKCLLSPENNMLATCSADSEIRLWERKPAMNDDGSNQTDSKGNNILSTDCQALTDFLDSKKGMGGASNLFEDLFISMDILEESDEDEDTIFDFFYNPEKKGI